LQGKRALAEYGLDKISVPAERSTKAIELSQNYKYAWRSIDEV
jgi:hypothetical protein